MKILDTLTRYRLFREVDLETSFNQSLNENTLLVLANFISGLYINIQLSFLAPAFAYTKY